MKKLLLFLTLLLTLALPSRAEEKTLEFSFIDNSAKFNAFTTTIYEEIEVNFAEDCPWKISRDIGYNNNQKAYTVQVTNYSGTKYLQLGKNDIYSSEIKFYTSFFSDYIIKKITFETYAASQKTDYSLSINVGNVSNLQVAQNPGWGQGLTQATKNVYTCEPNVAGDLTMLFTNNRSGSNGGGLGLGKLIIVYEEEDFEKIEPEIEFNAYPESIFEGETIPFPEIKVKGNTETLSIESAEITIGDDSGLYFDYDSQIIKANKIGEYLVECQTRETKKYKSVSCEFNITVVENPIKKIDISFPSKIYSAIIGEDFNSPKVIIGGPYATEITENDIIYLIECDNSEATINEKTGEVSILAEGTATITAQVNKEGYSGEASYYLEIVDPHDTDVTFDFTSELYGMGPAYSGNNTAYVSTNNTATNGPVSILFTGNKDSWRFWDDGLRAYQGKNAQFIISVENGFIREVELTSKGRFSLDGKNSINSWTGREKELTFQYLSTDNNAIKYITVFYEIIPEANLNTIENIVIGREQTVDFPEVTETGGETIEVDPESIIVYNQDGDEDTEGLKIEDGKITGVLMGEYTVTFTTVEDKFLAAEGSFNVTVTLPEDEIGLYWNPSEDDFVINSLETPSPVLKAQREGVDLSTVTYQILKEISDGDNTTTEESTGISVTPREEGRVELTISEECQIDDIYIIRATYPADGTFKEESADYKLYIMPNTQSYSIIFKGSGGDDSGTAISEIKDTHVIEGFEFIESSSASTVYNGKNDYGLKFGTEKLAGSLTIDLTSSHQVVVSSVVIKAIGYNNNKETDIKFTVNGCEKEITSKTEFEEFHFIPGKENFNAGEGNVLKTLKINGVNASNKRFYIQSITVNYEVTPVALAWEHTSQDDLSSGVHNILYTKEGHTYTLKVDPELPDMSWIETVVTPKASSNNNSEVAMAAENNDGYELDQEKNVVTITKAGTYNLSTNYTGSLNYSVQPVTLTSTVEPINVTVATIPTKAWSKEAIDYDVIMTSNAPETEDLGLTLNVTPDFTPVTMPDGDFNEKTWGINQAQWGQIEAIQKYNEGTAANIDGYYDDPKFDTKFDGNLTIQYNCSGKYNISIESSDESIIVSGGNQTVDVYPTTTLTYLMPVGNTTYEDGLTINYYGVTDSGEIGYGKDKDGNPAGNLSNAGLSVPGTYLMDVYYKVTSKSVQSDQTEDHLPDSEEQENLSQFKAPSKADSNNVTIPEGYEKAMKGNFLDISALSADNPIDLDLILVKNGAATPLLDKSTGKSEANYSISITEATTTGVETIGAEEDGEEIYFDLNGFRVNPDNLQHGIYIVRKGNTTHKVII